MKPNFPKNKWFIAFLIMAIVAVAAASVAVVIGVIANRPPEYTEGDEMGVYYYDLEDGEVLLTLSTGNKFTIAGPGMNKTGTYIVEGSTLTLDFFKDEDGMTTATINGDALSLIYADATMNFLKKIDYTVSFNVNGGDAIPSVKVVNGKAVANPGDANKNGSVFLGWYADEALTQPFNFATTIIKADTTIYARWADKTIGVPEYTVDFDLGFEGDAIESITTISGKAYGVTAPTREGYTFGGWWISMTDDGEKLSYAYTENTVFTSNTTLYAVWCDNAATNLDAPAVTVTDSTISWNAVDGATSYLLSITAPDGTILVENESIGATSKAYSFADLAAGEYVISVVAVASDEAKNSAPAVRYYVNKQLGKVTNFQVVNGILIFSAVENAEKYLITIDCGNDDHNHTAFDNGNSTTYYIANCPMQAGGILINVTAEAKGYASSTSRTYAYDLTLDKVTKVEYDAAKDAFVWDAVAGATEYLVTVTVGETTVTVVNGNFTTFSAARYTGNITVSVVPATEGYNSPEGTVASCEKTAPAMPSGLAINGMIISWNEAAGAATYEVKIGTTTVIVDTTSIDVTAYPAFTLNQGYLYDVQVRAISAANEASAYSAPVDFGYFAMVNSLTYSKNTVSWAPVLGDSVSYKVRVNGKNTRTITDATSARVTLTQAGANLIEVMFCVNGEEASEWMSITVNAIAVEYDTRSSFGSFYTEYLAVGDAYTLPGVNFGTGFYKDGYNFVAWATSPMGSASNGAVLSDGAIFNGNAHTILYGTWTPKDYNITLDISGVGFNVTNIVNGDTQTVTYTKDYTLPVPEAGDVGMYKFAGWFSEKNGEGRQYTDGTGASLEPYSHTRDITLYAYYSTSALSFKLKSDGTYIVTSGPSIDEVTDLVIPVTYKDKLVTEIEASAFSSCNKLLTIQIPDTIQYVHTKALKSTQNLKSIEVYVAYPEEAGTYETFYSSANGALLRNDMGTMYLEIVPKAVGETFTVPGNVDAILPGAFHYSKVVNIIVPATVTNVPESAFNVCVNLKSVIFEGGRTDPLTLDKGAFVTCSALEIIEFPALLDYDFDTLKILLNNFGKLKSVTFEEGNANFATINGMVVSQDKHTLLYCPKGYQGKLSIPGGIYYIEDNAFASRTLIESVEIPVWVKTIGSKAFNNATGIKSLTFAGSRSEDLAIGANAFANCYAMESITFLGNGTTELDEGMITFENSVFSGSSANSLLASVTIGEGVNIRSFSQNMFKNQARLKTVTISDTAYVGSISAYAFSGCLALTSFRVPATVSSIANYAFEGCNMLSDISFAPDGDADPVALNIANYAFMNCRRLLSVTLPDRLGTFNSAAFEGCNALKSITVSSTNPNYVDDNGVLFKKATEGGYDALLFYPTALIEENNGVIDNLPSTLTKIGGSAFSNNAGLISITIPASVSSIDASAFANCPNLTKVVFLGASAENTEGLTLAIKENAFENCYALTDFVLPSYTKSIGNYAFRSSGLVTLVIPESLTSLGKGAFYKCASLTTVEFKNKTSFAIPDGNGSKPAAINNGGVFAECTALTTVNLGSNVSVIGKNAFDSCTALRRVTIGTENSKLTRIANQAFYLCSSLEAINIPKTVTAIGTSAFACSAAVPGSLTAEGLVFELGGTAALNFYQTVFQYQSSLTSITFPARANLYSGKAGTTSDANGNKIQLAVTYTDYNSKTTANGIADSFLGCTALASVNFAVEEGITPTYASRDGVLYTAGMDVLIFCPAANAGTAVEGVATIVIPNTVKLVLSKSFLNLTVAKTVTFEEFDKENENYGTQLLIIGHYSSANAAYITFGGATTSITAVNLPSHLSTIRSYAFAVTGEVADAMAINFNKDASNLALSNSAFRSCIATSLALPGVKTMGTDAFRESKRLETVTFAKYAPTSIPNYTFQDAVKLSSFTIPVSVTSIGTAAFSNCTSLASIDLNNNPESTTASKSKITTINTQAFKGSGLTSVTLPSTVKTLNSSLFFNCKSLTTATIEGAVTTIAQEMFFGCSNLTTVNFTNLANITTINNYAFIGCEKLTSFDFTKMTKLSSVKTSAFSHTGLTKVDLSKCTSLTKLTNAFNNIPTLKEFIFAPSMNTIDTSIGNAMNYNGYWANGMPFVNNSGLEKITLSKGFNIASMSKNGAHALEYVMVNCPNIQITTQYSSTSYTIDEYGILYSGDTLIWAPPTVVLDEYVVPDDIYAISDYAFAFSNIGSIVVHRFVEEIGSYAFYYANTTSVTLSDTLADPSEMYYIGEYAFAHSKITSIVIPDSVEEVGSYIFAYCPNLTSITTGASLLEIPMGFAEGTTSLAELNLQEGITYMDYIFWDPWDYQANPLYASKPLDFAHQLKTVTIPSTVTAMYATFHGMNGLETVNFANGSQLAEIYSFAFRGCQSLTSITLPASVEYMEDGIFEGCFALKSADLSATSLYELYEYAFAYTYALETLKLPDTMEAIGNRAFYCTGLLELNLPESVVAFGIGAFENATRLKTITFEETSTIDAITAEYIALDWFIIDPDYGGYYPELDETNANVFRGTTALETATIPNSVKTIGNKVFENSSISQLLMTDPTADSSLKEIGAYAFANCANLTAFSYTENPDDPENAVVNNYFKNVTYIGDAAFLNCSKLENVSFGYSLEYLGGMAFAYCTSLDRAYIPASVIEIGGNPYAGFDLSKVEVDSSNSTFFLDHGANGETYLVDIYGEYIWAVWGATGELTINSGSNILKYAAGALSGNALTKVIISEGVTSVADFLFMNCTTLTEVVLPESLTSIGAYAFYNTAITEISVPEKATAVGEKAFANCSQLEKVIFNYNPTSAYAKLPTNDNLILGSDKAVFTVNTFRNNYAYITQIMAQNGFTELHVETMDATNSIESFITSAVFNKVDANFSLYFDGTSYEKLVELFAKVSYSWDLKIYDSNGYQLFCNSTSGAIVLVLDAEGNTVWQA